MLPPLPDGQHSYHQGELVRSPDMHCDRLQPSDLSLSPPAALPSTILHLPIHLDARSLPLTHSPPETPPPLNDDQSFMDPFTSVLDDSTFLRRPSPLRVQSWLDVETTSLAELIHPPRPLFHEPLQSVWSPSESPPPIEELDEMVFDPSSSRSSTISSLWSLGPCRTRRIRIPHWSWQVRHRRGSYPSSSRLRSHPVH